MLEFLRQTNPRARKQHICQLCKGVISTGEKYIRQSGKYDGDMFDDCYCETCDNILQSFCLDEGEHEYSEDWISDWLHDKYCINCSVDSPDDSPYSPRPCTYSSAVKCPIVRKDYSPKDVN